MSPVPDVNGWQQSGACIVTIPEKMARFYDIYQGNPGRLLKNTHLLRYAHPSSLQRTCMYASFLRISRALHPDVFEQPGKSYFFNHLPV
jgi:hypothetical protein